MSGQEEGLVSKGMNAKFSVGLPDFMTSTKEIKDKTSGSKEQVVTDSNGNTYKVKTDIDELNSKVLEASKNNENTAARKSESRVLSPNDGKHQGEAKGKISADPFWNNQAAGEKSLNTAYVDPNSKQLYNVYEGKLVTFRPDNVGGYHAYEVINTAQEVPSQVLRQMRDDGVITKAFYNKLIKNK